MKIKTLIEKDKKYAFVSNSSSEATVGQDGDTTADNSDNDTKASTDAEIVNLFGDGEAETVYKLDNDMAIWLDQSSGSNREENGKAEINPCFIVCKRLD